MLRQAKHLLPLISRMQVLETPIAESEVESSTDSGSPTSGDREIQFVGFDTFVQGTNFETDSNPDWLFEILMA